MSQHKQFSSIQHCQCFYAFYTDDVLAWSDLVAQYLETDFIFIVFGETIDKHNQPFLGPHFHSVNSHIIILYFATADSDRPDEDCLFKVDHHCKTHSAPNIPRKELFEPPITSSFGDIGPISLHHPVFPIFSSL